MYLICFELIFFPNVKSVVISIKGTRVPNAKITGYIIPIDDFKLMGITIPKNNQNKVGQKAKENIIPRINEGLNFLNLPMKLSCLLNIELPKENLNLITFKIYSPINITKGPVSFLVRLKIFMEEFSICLPRSIAMTPYKR